MLIIVFYLFGSRYNLFIGEYKVKCSFLYLSWFIYARRQKPVENFRETDRGSGRADCHRAVPPGMRLDETELANEFSVSRIPVREALIQLSSSGLVEIRSPRGAIVAEASPNRLYEMFEVMRRA